MLKKRQISETKQIFNFSSQQIDSHIVSPNNSNNNFTNNDLKQYLKNKSYIPTSKTHKSIKYTIKYEIKNFQAKTFELESDIKSLELDNNSDSKEDNNTSKIDYRHYKNYPINDIFPLKIENENQKFYWLVTYDKLMKTKNIIKILNHNKCNSKNKYNSKQLYTESNIKSKTMKIPNFELFFVKGFDKPIVRPNKNKFILAKLYLLTKNEINKILNYINRIDDKININKYISMNKKYSYHYIKIKNNSDYNKDFNYPYCYIYYLGKFMNISMYLFTNSFNYLETYNIKSNLIYSLPNSKKLYKLIKILIKSFPEYNPNYIINNIIRSDLYLNSKEKKYEIFNYLSLLKNTVPNKQLLNKVLHDTITGILVNSSISVSSAPAESGDHIKSSEKIKKEQIKTSEGTKNEIKISSLKSSTNKVKKCISVGNKKFELKNSINSKNNNNFLNAGQIGTTFLSTNHTLLPSNSVRNYSNQNSVGNNIPSNIIPYERKNRLRKTYGNYYFGNNRGKIPKINIKLKKISAKHFNYKCKNKEKNDNKNNKENIDINNILNIKSDDNIIINKHNNNKENIYNDGIYKKNKNNNKNSKEENNNKSEYHTPKKKKKIRYYK